MTHQLQHLTTTFIAKFSVIVTLSILICLPLSSLKAKETTLNNSITESLKIQLLEDSTFLSKLSEKLTTRTNDDYIREIVKDYLLQNPEIMIEMQLVLQKKLGGIEEQQAFVVKSLEKEIFQSPHDAVFGNPNGKVTLVEFFDYNCNFCKRFYPSMVNLIKEYPDLRIIIKDLPILGPDSIEAHTIAYAFRQQFPEKYFQFYKELLTSQNRANKAKAIKIAVSLGANEKDLYNAIENPNLRKSFKRNIQIASTLNINGTPSHIIGDKVFIGAVSEDILKEAIESIQ
uniref:Outer membrane protein n=4 Tax=Bartonella schoenbuchensis TaxID=165694 RepID=E6YZ86_BARSR|nr:Outer membrane protein [Bartonella schoenbuchensis R1]CDP80064.1 outer membrane protein [Bartonella schoenbuchensis]